MKLDFSDERVLAVVAHPDDAELLCAGTLARARADGAAIAICVMCQGDKGQSSHRIKNLAAVRRGEMKVAARLLGAQLFLGEFKDGELYDSIVSRRRLVEIYRRFCPTLILAHSLEDYHPDHRAAGVLAEAASWFAASRGQVTKSAALETPPALWWMDTINMSDFLPDFFVNVTDSMELKEKMLACHRSQVARGEDKDFSPLLELMRMQLRTRGTQAGVDAAEAFRAHGAFKRARAW